MTATTPGREVIQIVEIQQPLCANTFGSAPCTATGTADTKCYNTRATCQDVENFALGTPLSLYFSRGYVAEAGVSGAPYIIPSLVSVSTVPTKINLAGASPDQQGLGSRALVTVTFQDHQHTDRRVDPYVDGRSWDSLSKERGSFWSRWLTRNKYRKNIIIKVYEGYAGQALSAMNVRTYFMDSATWPDGRGRVTIKGKDVLARVEERKAQAPVASPGVLYTGIDSSVTSFEVAGAVEADYSATGTLRIDDEIMTYTGRSTSANGITFTGVTRATDNTTAAEHDVDTLVQECLRYTAERMDDVVEDLLTTYAGVDSSYLDTTGWASEFGDYMSFYNVTALFTEPESVYKHLSDLQTQGLFYLWWDERTALVKMKAIRGVEEEPDTLTDENHILADSLAITEHPRERASRVVIHYNRKDFVKDDDDPTAYTTTFIIANLTSESDVQYGEKAVREIFARWLPTDGLAQNTASKIITRYVDVPSRVKFRLDAKDRDAYWVADTVRISHWSDVDQYGERNIRQWTITSAQEIRPGEVCEYIAEDTSLYGRIHYIMASGAADYPGYDSAPFKNCYIGDSDGLLSDGERAGVIS